MGVKNLWQIIAPYGHVISIVELQKKKVAVDLSCWICQIQSVSEKNGSYLPKLHLRNIFFKTAFLLSAHVTPVFVMDGDPPEIKLSTLKKRNQVRGFLKCKGNLKVSSSNHEEKVKRERKLLKSTLKECQALLNFLGLECLWSCGEGEALCALLDKKGIVDGIITQDNDAFLYGGRRVYKNFTITPGFGTTEVFNMSDIEKHLNLTQEKLVAMSLLCGCDYDNTGIHGIGGGKCLKYLSNFDGDIFTRLKQLRHDKVLTDYDTVKNGCKRCHHPGKLSAHMKLGCTICGTQSKCADNISQYHDLSVNEKMRLDFELEVRQKTTSDPKFPPMDTVDEYLNFSQEISLTKGKWMEPDILGFILFMEEKCDWSKYYGFKKIAPLYTRWSLLNETFNDFIPRKLLKKRVLKGVPSFEVEWQVRRKLVDMLKNHGDCVDESVTTVEPEILIIEKCKELYESFMSEKCDKPKKGKKSKKARDKREGFDVDDLIESVDRLTIGNENMESGNFKCEEKFFSKHEKAENMNVSSVVFDVDESRDHGESGFSSGLNDSFTVDYDLNDYRINESSIIESIISRREYY